MTNSSARAANDVGSAQPVPVTDESNVHTWPAPADERSSPAFTVRVENRDVFVHLADVRQNIFQQPGLWSHKPDAKRQQASFAQFDFDQPVTVTVRPSAPFKTVDVLPRSAGVDPVVENGVIHLRLLHLLCSPPEAAAPAPDDPGVVFFGPGVHEVTEPIKLESGQTLYLSGGAVLRVKLRPGEEGKMHPKFNIPHYPGQVVVVHQANNVTIRGRGIIDTSAIPHPGRQLISIRNSRHVHLEGIVLRDASAWNVHINQSSDVEVANLKILAGRLNSDGINSVSSGHIHIHDCFVRNRDDSIVAKSKPTGPTDNLIVERCTIWNDWGYALGVTYETQSDIRDLVFRDCDVLQADGGTRTASITGAYVALSEAVGRVIKAGLLEKSPITDSVAAISCGV
ncbi:MAG: glycosyl hydrolase family 28 protein, partial [bacterium]